MGTPLPPMEALTPPLTLPKWIGCRAISLAPRCRLRPSYGLGARLMTVTPVFVFVGTPPPLSANGSDDDHPRERAAADGSAATWEKDVGAGVSDKILMSTPACV